HCGLRLGRVLVERDPPGVLSRESEAPHVRDLHLLAGGEVDDHRAILHRLALPPELLRLAPRGIDREGRVGRVAREGERRRERAFLWAGPPTAEARRRTLPDRERVLALAARLT